MVRIELPIEDTVTDIILPVTKQTVFKFLNNLGLDTIFDNNIYFLSDIESATNYYTSDGSLKLSGNPKCVVEYEPVYNPKNLESEIFSSKYVHILEVNPNAIYPIFYDYVSNIKITEFCLPININLNITMHLSSIDRITSLNLKLYTIFRQSSVFYYEDLDYYYRLPDYIILLLYKIYQIKKPYLEQDLKKQISFRDYLNKYATTLIDIIKNKHSKENKAIGVYKTKTKVAVKVNYNADKPETDKKEKLAFRFSLPIQLIVQFEVPVTLIAEYPPVLYNQILPKEFLIVEENLERLTDAEYPKAHVEVGINQALQSDATPKYPSTIFYPVKLTNIQTVYNGFHSLFLGYLQLEKDENGKYFIQLDYKQDILPLLPSKYDNIIATSLQEHTFADIYFGLAPICIQFLTDYNTVIPYEDIQFDPSTLTFFIQKDYLTHHKNYKVLIGIVKDLSTIGDNYIPFVLDHDDVFKPAIAFSLKYLKEKNYIEVKKEFNKIYYRRKDQKGRLGPWVLLSLRTIIQT